MHREFLYAVSGRGGLFIAVLLDNVNINSSLETTRDELPKFHLWGPP